MALKLTLMPRRRAMRTAAPASTSMVADGSGTTTAMLYRPCRPVIKEAFTTSPEVVYSQTDPSPWLTTNRLPWPSNARPEGRFNPWTNEAFRVDPEVVYSDTTPISSWETNKWPWLSSAALAYRPRHRVREIQVAFIEADGAVE